MGTTVSRHATGGKGIVNGNRGAGGKETGAGTLFGGLGGEIGKPGGAGQSGGAGGLAGFYLVGNSLVTWINEGTLLGRVS